MLLLIYNLPKSLNLSSLGVSFFCHEQPLLLLKNACFPSCLPQYRHSIC